MRKSRMTAAHRAALKMSQSGLCAICGKTPAVKKRDTLYVDHCHRTGEVRAMLCAACNTGLGMFGDSPDTIYKAWLYLTTHAVPKSATDPRMVKPKDPRNTGGWDTRRARYGVSGIKRKNAHRKCVNNGGATARDN